MSEVVNNFRRSVQYDIEISAKKLDLTCPVKDIVIDKRVNKIPVAKIVLYDGDIQSGIFPIANDKIFPIGAPITIKAGYGDDLDPVFSGVVAKLAIQSNTAGASTFTVTCRDVAYKTTIVPKTQHFANCKDSDLLKKIIAAYSGIKHQITETQVMHENITQHEISDWDFINIRAEANGQVVVVNNGTIAVKKPNRSKDDSLYYTYGSDLIDFNVELDAKDQWAAAMASSWDSHKQSAVSAQVNEPGEASIGDLSYKKLADATAQKPAMLSHAGIENPTEIKTLATSLLGRRRIAKVRGHATLQGNAKFLHDHLITIKKGAEHFEGAAYISGVRQIISGGDWKTVLTIGLDTQRYIRIYNDIGALPAAGMLPPMHGLQVGIVKQITKDPKNNNRILVHLPLIQSNPKEGIWCRLASFYATSKAGAFFVPELEDEVVVGFLNDDVRFPIILGALYSGKHAPPKVVDNKNVCKSFISREKLELTFNDDEKGPEIIIKTPKGGLIQISDKKQSLELIDQNNNKFVLSKDGINITSSKNITLNARGSITLQAGQDITVKGTKNCNIKGMNINATASMKAVLKGNASTEVNSGMVTTIKGTTVLIN